MAPASADDRAALLARHASQIVEQCAEAARARARIPRKERARRGRAAEDAATDAAALAARQARECEEAGVEVGEGEVDVLVAGISGVAVAEGGGEDEGKKESKAAKRRRVKAEKERESERMIAVEKAGMGVSERARENEEIVAQLTAGGFRIWDIAPDGHCLYAAVAHQLAEVGAGGEGYDISGLRTLVGDHMLGAKDDYIPFLEEVAFDDEKYVRYCERLKTAVVWGGQVELQALSRVLGRRVDVFAAGMPAVVMGDNESGDPLRLSFHRKYYDLGNHYNSVVKVRTSE